MFATSTCNAMHRHDCFHAAEPGTDSGAIEILLVDDEPAVRHVLELALRCHGIRAHVAESGAQALDLFRQHRERLNLVLLDVEMPELDGYHTCVALQQIDPTVRVVFMSGSTRNYTAQELLDLRALDLIAKPFPSVLTLAQTLCAMANPAIAC